MRRATRAEGGGQGIPKTLYYLPIPPSLSEIATLHLSTPILGQSMVRELAELIVRCFPSLEKFSVALDGHHAGWTKEYEAPVELEDAVVTAQYKLAKGRREGGTKAGERL